MHPGGDPLPEGRRTATRPTSTCWSWHVHSRHGVSRRRPTCPGSAQAELPGVRRPGGLRGFVFALATAAQFVAAGNSTCALVIGGDCNSRVINPGDQKSFPLFGDGAGAVLLAPGDPEQGLVAYQLGSDGSGGDLLSRPACGSRIPPTRRRRSSKGCIT